MLQTKETTFKVQQSCKSIYEGLIKSQFKENKKRIIDFSTSLKEHGTSMGKHTKNISTSRARENEQKGKALGHSLQTLTALTENRVKSSELHLAGLKDELNFLRNQLHTQSLRQLMHEHFRILAYRNISQGSAYYNSQHSRFTAWLQPENSDNYQDLSVLGKTFIANRTYCLIVCLSFLATWKMLGSCENPAVLRFELFDQFFSCVIKSVYFELPSTSYPVFDESFRMLQTSNALTFCELLDNIYIRGQRDIDAFIGPSHVVDLHFHVPTGHRIFETRWHYYKAVMNSIHGTNISFPKPHALIDTEFYMKNGIQYN